MDKGAMGTSVPKPMGMVRIGWKETLKKKANRMGRMEVINEQLGELEIKPDSKEMGRIKPVKMPIIGQFVGLATKANADNNKARIPMAITNVLCAELLAPMRIMSKPKLGVNKLEIMLKTNIAKSPCFVDL